MALNKETFRLRALTALIFVAVMMAGLLVNEWTFLLLLTLIHFGCWYEFIKILKRIYGPRYFPYTLTGILYITIPILMLVDLRIDWLDFQGMEKNFNFGITIPILIIFSIWVNDTMAYLVGSFIGRTPFSKISPKKTWEGTLGGAILCVLAIGFMFPLLAERFFVPFEHNYTYFVIAALCAFFGTLGDLLESKLKRLANVKDSGAIMPGHGGFLDRFDSLLVATPAVWLYFELFV